MANASPWQYEQVIQTLTELWKDHSATEIAARIWEVHRIPVSRNAVIGRLHRMGLTVDHKTEFHAQTNGHGTIRIRQPRTVSRSETRKHESVSVQTIALARDGGQLRAEPFVCQPDDVVSLSIEFDALTDKNCHWPDAGDSPFRFCGHPALAGHSYCIPHVIKSRPPETKPYRPKHHVNTGPGRFSFQRQSVTS